MARLLIVDDEESILNVLSVVLKTEKFDVIAESNGENAMALLEKEKFDLMLSDIRMSPVNGMQLLKHACDVCPNMPVIMLTAFSSMETASEALKLGAFDYILKPFKVDELVQTIQNAIAYSAKDQAAEAPTVDTEFKCYLDNIIAESTAMRETCEMLKKVAPVDTPALILGEVGTGKKSMAQCLHNCSHRKDGPFHAVNCAELPEPLLDSAIFGHLKDSFEGASEDKDGMLETANGGSIHLVEIGEMPLSIQQKLLTYMQTKVLKKIGSSQVIEVNTRVIASSNTPLETLLKDGRFLQGLYQRLSIIPIKIKPLRDRIDDVIPLTCFLIQQHGDKDILPQLAPDVCAILESYTWPGNCKELQNVIKHALENVKDGVITKDSLPQNIADTPLVKNRRQDDEAVSVKGKSLKAFLSMKKQEYLQQFTKG